MIRYDWNILRKYSQQVIFDVLYNLELKTQLKYADKEILIPISQFKDTSAFLLNPYFLIFSKDKHTSSEIYFYLELAAYRSYFDYTQTGRINLPINYIKGQYNLDKIKLNTTLIVTDEDIIFKYEEK